MFFPYFLALLTENGSFLLSHFFFLRFLSRYFLFLTSSLFIDFFYLLPFPWDAPSSLPMFNISQLHFSIIFSTFHVTYYL